MKKVKYSFKVSLLFLVLGLVSNIHIIAQSQGPVAPEAASFEPIDATDMVNLSTGGFTYVLPILNVPSPEGGYPLALAYHAGIAMDQESTWTGLGWNLNAGAINRSVNGYPDDYNSSLINEYFYDEGDKESIYSLSLGYTNGGFSSGLGLSWGSNRSLGGYVSIGYGAGIEGFGKLGGSVRIGTDGIGISGGATLKGGMTLGVSASSNGGVSGSVGFDNNGSGFSISTNGSLSVDLVQSSGKDNQVAIGLTLSSSGLSLDAKITNKTGNKVDGGAGIGIQLQFENTIQMGDYTTKTSGWMIPLVAPTPIGVFSLSFGKQEFRYYLAKNENNYVSGPVYYQNVTNNYTYRVTCYTPDYYEEQSESCGYFTTNSLQEAEDFVTEKESASGPSDCQCEIKTIGNDAAFMDIYEVPLDGLNLSGSSKADFNNPVFPNYDKYNVQAQGLSGGMSSRLFDNGALFGLTGKENKEEYKLKYSIDGSSPVPFYAKFPSKPYFYFDNEISTYSGFTDVSTALFNNSDQSNILSYYSGGAGYGGKPRRKNGNYIEYFSNNEINNSYSSIKNKGFLKSSASGFDRTKKPLNGIGAFKVTSIDGKTYHYSLPVYNHEIITRTFGVINERPNENQSYFEKRQLEAYATHWLLTAVTGPDFYDKNENGIADEGDYGYWISFNYGKWSDAFVWKNPYGKEYFEANDNTDTKTWIRGRKELYYLDKVKTRTHTALFIKSQRQDGKSVYWNYQSVVHRNGTDQNSNAFQSRFSIPSQYPLKLDKIILIKNEDDNLSKSYGSSSEGYVDIKFNDSEKPEERAYYNLKDNVIDNGDNWTQLIDKSIKVIDLNYNHELAKGSPNTPSIGSSFGRLTLNSVTFKGKKGESVMPPYQFSYKNDLSYIFDIEDKDGFGFNANDNSLWSLKEIKTPQGGRILIDYEPHNFKPVVDSKITFSRSDPDYKMTLDMDGQNMSTGAQPRAFIVESKNDLGMQIGDRLYIDYLYTGTKIIYYPTDYDDQIDLEAKFKGWGIITQDLGNNKFFILPDYQNYSWQYDTYNGSQNPGVWACDWYNVKYDAKYTIQNPIEAGGMRVSSLTTTDGVKNYRTEYKYGENEDGIGYVSYLPFAPELEKELPYSSELPFPNVMYEFVSMETKNTNDQSDGKTQYKFKILKEKDVNKAKFGDLYEIDVSSQDKTNTIADKKVNISNYTIKDNLATLGQLLEVSSYNSEGHLLNKIVNTYYTPDETPNNFGKTKESYQSYKTVDYVNNTSYLKDKWLINTSTRIKYPNLLKYSTEYKNNNQYSTKFNDLDPITGQARELFSYSSEGIKFKTKTVPAYLHFSGMGSKVVNSNNVNMLTQKAASYSYLIDPITGDEKIINASITKWSNEWNYRGYSGIESSPSNISEKIWRKRKTFVWKGDIDSDGAYLGYNHTNDDGFNWGIGQAGENQSNPKWNQISLITRYDHYSSSLEMKDINNNKASSKKGDNDSKVIAVSNSAYTEMFYSGAEYLNVTNPAYFDGEIKSNYRSSEKYHTGKYSIKVSANQPGFYTVLRPNEHRATKYKISVWVHKENYSNARVQDGVSIKLFNGEQIIAGDWVLLNHYVDLTSEAKNIYVTSNSGYVYYDDFRIHPVSSTMTSYVYNDFDEVAFITGVNGLSICYTYDSAGRLKETFFEAVDNPSAGITGGFIKVQENKYHYKNN